MRVRESTGEENRGRRKKYYYMFALLLLFPMHLLMTTAGEQDTGLTQTFGLIQFSYSYIKYFKKSDKDHTYHLTA